jgi:murein DD-endopeptidase MepM/ murein hydrolase activator NlpD
LTFAEYAHLSPGGALAQLGDRVAPERPIGLSGNSGFSTAPHLHFAVYHTVDGRTRSTLPVEFRGATGAAFTPEQGKSY